MSKIPHKIPDRRHRSLSRKDPSDRRQSPRYSVDFPVKIYIGEGEDQQEFEGTVADLSDGGVRLNKVDLGEGTKKVRLKFHPPEGSLPEEYDDRTYDLEGEVVSGESEASVRVKFEEPLSKKLERGSWAVLRGSGVLLMLAALVLILFIKYNNFYYFWFDAPVFLYSMLVGVYLLTRFLFALMYRPPKESGLQPYLSIVIPAHNEEDVIERTVRDIMETRYPAEKLEVIVVNDGSEDATSEKLKGLRKTYPELVVMEFQQAQGKREALATGVHIAQGEIIIFIDSDSFLQEDSLEKIVDGFTDPKVAAVTGHCDVENRWDNVLTRMQTVRYMIGFRIMKAAESLFYSVTCLSGPFSAYRREILDEHLEEWRNQTFLGQPATFGDDRSLTNFLLQNNERVIYDSRAICTTMVPNTFKVFWNQQLRWKRSWFRESLRACKFMWKKEPFMAISFYLGFLLPLAGPVVVVRALALMPIMQQRTPLVYLGGIFLLSTLISTTYLIMRRSKLWIYGIHFCFFYLFVLIWQLPWAVLTFWKTNWGTRIRENEV